MRKTTAATKNTGSTLLDVDYRRLISGADLEFDQPITHSDLGLPIGNGRMGSLVWISRNAIRLQINRSDVFPADSSTESLIEAPPIGEGAFAAGYQDYCCGTALVDITFHGPPSPPDSWVPFFPSPGTHQHLSMYDGVLTIEKEGFKVSLLASAERDVMVVRLDEIPSDTAVTAVLKMLRPPVVKIREHTATSTLTEEDGRITLGQVFEEGDFYSSSGAALGVSGAGCRVEQPRDMAMQLSFNPGDEPATIFVGTAASFSPDVDTPAVAVREVDEAAAEGFYSLLEHHTEWWQSFWSRSFISVPGFREIERIEARYLYLMGSSSRGAFPPKYNFGLWNTHGDQHDWGSQFWWWNQSCIHHSVYASNHLELNDPLYRMISNNLDAYATAAKQQWGSDGIWIPETQWFDGIEELAEEDASELRALYLEEKPFSDMSPRLRELSLRKHPFSARWNYLFLGTPGGSWQNRREGIFGHVSHILVVAPKIAHLFWLQYQYTMDLDWLRDRAYPILRGAAEFYRNHPRLTKESDGKYHLYGTHSHEHLWGAKDVMDDLGLIRGLFPTLIRASEILGVDEDMRPVWDEVVSNLAPYPMSDVPGAVLPLKHPEGLPTWAEGYEPCRLTRGGNGSESPRLRPLLEYDVLTLESEDEENWAVAMATVDAHPGSAPDVRPNETSRYGTEVARAGRTDLVQRFLTLNLRERPWPTVLANGLSTLEGGGSMQYLGTCSDAVQQALMQCIAPEAGAEPVLRVFPAWPTEWDAAFQLLAKGGFLVSSSMRSGVIEFVELRSQVGGECRMRNPWPGSEVSVFRNGATKAEDSVEGPILSLSTRKDEILILVKAGTTPEQFRRAVW